MSSLLPSSDLAAIAGRTTALFDEETLIQARSIVDDVRTRGRDAVVEHALRLGDLASADDTIIYSEQMLADALTGLPSSQQELLKRTAERISRFAGAQKNSLGEASLEISGALAGHFIAPVETAGCYAPGGRYPLPSSVLMTACTARAAGVKNVIVCSPKPTPVTLAAAAVAGADCVLGIGGAHAIAAMAYGAGLCSTCDIITGPGNKWVTAAKHLISLSTGIDMLAGPSELVVVCDDSAKPDWIAADLIAQAEHDTDAVPILISLSELLIDEVKAELAQQLETLPTAATARTALEQGAAFSVQSIEEAVDAVRTIAPEHLQLSIKDADKAARLFDNYGAIFVGENSTEVLCDYGAGPNHVLPTGGCARFTGGLSVFTFLRTRTWLMVQNDNTAARLAEDAAALAELEGLHGHARAARVRSTKQN